MNLRPAFGIVVPAILGATACTDPVAPDPLPEGCSSLITLDYALGDFERLKGAGDAAFPCLYFDAQQSADHEYVLLFENLAQAGAFAAALFPGPAADTTFAFTLDVEPLIARAVPPAAILAPPAAAAAPDHTWDFGAGGLREHHPKLPAGAEVQPALLRGNTIGAAGSALADPQVGDTIQVRLEGVPRLGIVTGPQNAIIRFISDELIIAEDTRLATLERQGGGFNLPIPDADLAAIAAEYAAHARVQGDLFFENRHNTAVETGVPSRVIAVHSLTPNDSIWGYTYSVTNYFVWDYWVATDGSTRGLNQHPQRVADNLFMHEIAHMRHFGLLQRNGLFIGDRGNNWLVEGFARFAERLPIAARLLGSTAPSRTANLVLPRNPAFGNSYFMDDVPTYLQAGASMYFGYHTSAFVFDYFADQVALRGGDWLTAMREFLLAGRARTSLDAVVQRWLPGTTFADLVTQSRIALHTDDIGTAGLPPWTQYAQYRLRESRPAPAQSAAQDPRVQWTPVSPADRRTINGVVKSGGAVGFVIAGASAPSAVFRFTGPQGTHATLSIARIR